MELVNSGIEGSCNPTQLVVFIIQQEGVESSIYLFILLCDQCWECPLVKVWSLGLVSNTAIAACLLFYCISTACNITTIHHTPVLDSKALFWCRCYCSYLFIPPVFHYLFAELVHLLGVLGTQETSCFVVAGLHERDIFDLFLPEIDKPWVIHLRETCCCSTNLCSWRPNTVYRNRSVRRHQAIF